MRLYSAADLHSNNHFLTIIDEQDKRILEKRLPNELSVTLKTLEPYRADISGIAVESTFNWYRLVDGLMEAGYHVMLVNPSKVRQYEGLKHTVIRAGRGGARLMVLLLVGRLARTELYLGWSRSVSWADSDGHAGPGNHGRRDSATTTRAGH